MHYFTYIHTGKVFNACTLHDLIRYLDILKVRESQDYHVHRVSFQNLYGEILSVIKSLVSKSMRTCWDMCNIC